ncbi:MAG: V-type sodium ATPase catalytic subunit A [candidate division WS2 bacterium]|nr:V-type sodium ATPase catalytic subunit A [Candidatus Lithacetigena glycinireducens]
MIKGKIAKVSGPLVIANNMSGVQMFEIVRVGEKELFGEVIETKGDLASIQVYEETEGLKVGEEVISTGNSLSVELGPGIMGGIYDGIQRPLKALRDLQGDFISRGISVSALDTNKKWLFQAIAKQGDQLTSGDFLGFVQETHLVKHYIMIPPGLSGKILEIKEGEFTINENVATLKDSEGVEHHICMMQKYPVRIGRPFVDKLQPNEPLITGQRVFDAMFPIFKGGTACIPGPFGSGKTVMQHQLARWSDADIIIYVGCGERGNEMTEVLIDFPELKDPRSGRPLMERTVLIANTSNMPVAARETSVFTGIAIAEYFRDMGYNVAMMADSTSRWAEAMREVSGRLEEMPGEEGYPAYLGSRIASFYERAGKVKTVGNPGRTATLSVIGAVSPPGGDLSDPVVQATLREVRVFWGLDARLAFARHFPSINWLISYSLYSHEFEKYFEKGELKGFNNLRKWALKVLEEESELQEIVRLVGMDALSPNDRLTLEVARSIREDFLQQNSYHEIDTYTSLSKQFLMLKVISTFEETARMAVQKEVEIESILELPLKESISRMKEVKETDLQKLEILTVNVKEMIAGLIGGRA